MAGFSWPGHTEMLAELTGTKDYAMVLVGGGLNVILVTIHTALRDVPSLVTKEAVLKTIRLARRAAAMFGVASPRIAVAGLNPHAGEDGAMGREEIDTINPAAQRLRAEGVDISDARPGDTIFHEALHGRFDAVIAMYHDQGLPVLKHAGFGRAVNITLGLPLIRTSVDHGTALELAGSGRAEAGSFMEAERLAIEMARSAHGL